MTELDRTTYSYKRWGTGCRLTRSIAHCFYVPSSPVQPWRYWSNGYSVKATGASSRAVFCNFGTMTLNMSLLVGSCPGHCSMFSRILVLYSLDARNILPSKVALWLRQPKSIQILRKCPLESKISLGLKT